ncbi:uncharacterized protein LOC118744238 isoform X1 [Rhagoletis pomonella]|uniref:uncharacterized protein LOC118744238 isoform X1 n=1 Tax=Rhagoletis pomonella TaxID=28610 RepID=UPI00177FAAF7|nr:uncharacterized protein LOC118744238 isoform X1 [Rhagoletis pomonella]
MAGHRALEDSDLALIGRVKMTPALYDPRDPDFRLAYRKEQEWEVVGSMIGMSSAEARRRWTCLRDRYSRELKQVRMHPEKNEYGNNPFFRQMDFLRRFVRKRRNRRRHGYLEYEFQGPDFKNTISIEHATQLPNKTQNSGAEEDDGYSLENCNDAQSDAYADKIDESTMETEEYPEFVDVDAGDVYEECVETPASETDIKQQPASHFRTSSSSKQINATVVPIVVTQHDPNHAVYTLSTSHGHHEMSTPENHATLTHASQHKPNHDLYAGVKERKSTFFADEQSSSQQSQLQIQQRPNSITQQQQPNSYQGAPVAENEDDLFGKSIAVYLRQLSRRHKIKAQVEMFQILEKYIELEESGKATTMNSK